MKLLIIGATGQICSAAVEAALGKGHEVTAFVRSPDRLGDVRERVRVVQGDLSDAAALAAAVPGHDAVISAVGASPDKAQLDIPATGMRALIAAMEGAEVRRLVGLAGGAVNVPGERKRLGSRIAEGIVKLFARHVVEAKQREFDVVRSSDLDWTMVRPPNVVSGPATGRVEIGEVLHGFRVTSADVGAAMVELATSSAWLRQAPYVSKRLA